jgi:hypothetical protein
MILCLETWNLRLMNLSSVFTSVCWIYSMFFCSIWWFESKGWLTKINYVIWIIESNQHSMCSSLLLINLHANRFNLQETHNSLSLNRIKDALNQHKTYFLGEFYWKNYFQIKWKISIITNFIWTCFVLKLDFKKNKP